MREGLGSRQWLFPPKAARQKPTHCGYWANVRKAQSAPVTPAAQIVPKSGVGFSALDKSVR